MVMPQSDNGKHALDNAYLRRGLQADLDCVGFVCAKRLGCPRVVADCKPTQIF